MTDLDFNATDNAACRQYGQWLHHRGYTETWQAYDPMVRSRYSAELHIGADTLDEIDRVMADPFFGVPA